MNRDRDWEYCFDEGFCTECSDPRTSKFVDVWECNNCGEGWAPACKDCLLDQDPDAACLDCGMALIDPATEISSTSKD